MSDKILSWLAVLALLFVETAAYCQETRVKEIYIRPWDDATITPEPGTLFKVTMESQDGRLQHFTVSEGTSGQIVVGGDLVIDRKTTMGAKSMTFKRQVESIPKSEEKINELIESLRKAVRENNLSEVSACTGPLGRMPGAGEYLFKMLTGEKEESVREHIRRPLQMYFYDIKDILINTLRERGSDNVIARLEAAKLLQRAWFDMENVVGNLTDALRSDPAGAVRAEAAVSLTFLCQDAVVAEHILTEFRDSNKTFMRGNSNI